MSVGYGSTESLPSSLHFLSRSRPIDLERSHFRWALAASIVAVLATPFASSLGVHAQLGFLAATVGLFGLPHGALDFIQARVLLEPRAGTLWPLVFTAGYGAVIAAVLASWYWFPGASLVVFLAASALHFGAEDAMALGLRGPWRYAEIFARGSVPILVPLAFHAETTRFLSWLLPEHAALDPGSMQHASQLGLGVVALVIAASSISGTTRAEVTRLVVLASVFVALPPLVAFPVYFCVWHAPRHVLALSRELAMTPRQMARGLTLVAAPLTAVVLAGAAAAWLYLRVSGIDFAPATARVVFVGLSALTAPHMLLAALFERQKL